MPASYCGGFVCFFFQSSNAFCKSVNSSLYFFWKYNGSGNGAIRSAGTWGFGFAGSFTTAGEGEGWEAHACNRRAVIKHASDFFLKSIGYLSGFRLVLFLFLFVGGDAFQHGRHHTVFPLAFHPALPYLLRIAPCAVREVVRACQEQGQHQCNYCLDGPAHAMILSATLRKASRSW